MPENNIKLLIASNSKLFLDGIRKVLENEDNIEIIAETLNIKELNRLLKDYSPEVVFIDNREFKLNIEKLLRSRIIKNNQVRIILFTQGNAEGQDSPNLVNVNHETTTSELVSIIKCGTGEKKDSGGAGQDKIEYQNITKMEHRIIKFIAAGDSNKEIAEKLSISEKTVKAHVSSIFEKLNINNRYQLMVFGRRNKKNLEMYVQV
ncbi:MAG: response regulator transcription factor [Deltaproteobacteria bacterium]